MGEGEKANLEISIKNLQKSKALIAIHTSVIDNFMLPYQVIEFFVFFISWFDSFVSFSLSLSLGCVFSSLSEQDKNIINTLINKYGEDYEVKETRRR